MTNSKICESVTTQIPQCTVDLLRFSRFHIKTGDNTHHTKNKRQYTDKHHIKVILYDPSIHTGFVSYQYPRALNAFQIIFRPTDKADRQTVS